MVYALAIVSTPLVAAGWSAWLQARPALAVRRGVAIGVFAALACSAPLYSYRDHAPGFGWSSYAWPRDQFEFIRVHGLRGRSFVSDVWAGPFLGEFYPGQRAFFDPRLEAYSEDFALNVYQRIRYGEPGWDALLDRYEIDTILLRYTTAGEAGWQAGKPNLRQRLVADPRYSLSELSDLGVLCPVLHYSVLLSSNEAVARICHETLAKIRFASLPTGFTCGRVAQQDRVDLVAIQQRVPIRLHRSECVGTRSARSPRSKPPSADRRTHAAQDKTREK